MRKFPCNAVPENGLKFSTSVGFPVSPWMVSMPPDALLVLTSEPPQAAVLIRAAAAAGAHSSVGVRRFIASPSLFRSEVRCDQVAGPVTGPGSTGRGATGCAPRRALGGKCQGPWRAIAHALPPTVI